MGKTFELKEDSVIIWKDGKSKEYQCSTVKGACLKVFIKNINKALPVKLICDEADKIYLKYNDSTFADRGRDIRSMHLKDGLIIKDKLGKYKFTGNFSKTVQSTFSQKLKKQILEKYKYKCAMCGLSKDDGIEVMVDHIIPESKGGQATFENGMVLCTTCNNLKSNYSVKEFGKKMFATYLEIAVKQNDQENTRFFQDILSVFEKHQKN